MRENNSATIPQTIAIPTPGAVIPGATSPAGTAPAPRRGRGGVLCAAAGVLAFSLTFPSTVWGLEGFGPWSLIALRSLLAGVLAAGCLAAARVAPPAREHRFGLLAVAAGVVVGFPLLTTLALRSTTTSHAAVVVGLLPLTTAACAAWRTGVRPSRTFWTAALVGAALVLALALAQGGGAPTGADGLLFAALLLCAFGYTEGGRLARLMPGWQVIGWALVACLPLSALGAVLALSVEPVSWNAHGVLGLLWAAAGSTFLGLWVWYRGMAEIGPARAGQFQLAQPLLTVGWSVLLLGESPSPAVPLVACGVLVCIAVTQRR
ncbi:DMT family transporter [Streptomyces sp. BI20]|uniref:DMT family transporter n=1 Tax=Streptomyces sp. BI20 TaxID=3403460 RepID=UPI003C738837